MFFFGGGESPEKCLVQKKRRHIFFFHLQVKMLDTNSNVGTELHLLTPCDETGATLPTITPEEFAAELKKKKDKEEEERKEFEKMKKISQGIPETTADKNNETEDSEKFVDEEVMAYFSFVL